MIVMEEEEISATEKEKMEYTNTAHHTRIPAGLSGEEFEELKPVIYHHHTYRICTGKCSSLLAQRIQAPIDTVWSIVRRFDKPQTYKHFIKSCFLKEGSQQYPTTVGCLREVNVISGLPAATSTERLDILDDERHVTGFSIIGGEHRLKNYRSVTTVNECKGGDGRIRTVVLESYVVDVPEGNTDDDTRMFADTVVKLNLQKLASVTEGLARDANRRNSGLYSFCVE
ncbi:PREDICTED: abscisic acid receptor PYR1-like isoform X2 [Nelumbo nucifera]|uniref:Abscisic acid receptor PYR1-like isoform X2 n=1 Tax=Nelumbo nucifera TaxID=4432 RepID=A0A1U8AYC6_NELNU|nr:PREDICTED: abscisic acid receptor PYR1-like isoform X2 [Nelumbo nucifera]